MANEGMGAKNLQYVMGHSKVEMTLNVYTHSFYDDVKHEMQKIQKRYVEQPELSAV